MNIFRPQIPYVFHPPKYSPVFGPFLKRLATKHFMERKFNVRETEITGLDRIAELNRQKRPVLITPNHADHADPSVLVYAAKQAGMTFHFMAAREGFERSRVTRFALQRMGAFSVDREGADIAAIKTAINILVEARFPLVIFPEGEIYHHHEVLDELNEGVATIGLRAARKAGPERPFYVVPTALRFTHDPSVAASFSERLSRLEREITWKPVPHMDPVDRVYRLGGGLLAVKEEEWLGHAQQGRLSDRIRQLQSELLRQVESRHGVEGGEERLPRRVKALRSRIRSLLTDRDKPLSDREQWDLYDDLDRLFGAVQLYSYPDRYLKDHATIDRLAETLLKIEEDVLGDGTYPAPRKAFVHFGEPVETHTFLAEHDLDAKSGVLPLTHLIAERIQAMLETAPRNDSKQP